MSQQGCSIITLIDAITTAWDYFTTRFDLRRERVRRNVTLTVGTTYS